LTDVPHAFFVSRARTIPTNDRIKAEKEAKIKAAEDEVRRKAQEEAKRKADEEARVKAEQVSITFHTAQQSCEKHAAHCPAELWLEDEC
jgi:membrane protein involved in colicin uptake